MKIKLNVEKNLRRLVLLVASSALQLSYAAVAVPIFAITSSTNTVKFGVGASASINYTIKNNANSALAVQSVVPNIIPQGAAIATKTTNNCSTLASGASCIEAVSITSNTVGKFELNLTVTAGNGEATTTIPDNQNQPSGEVLSTTTGQSFSVGGTIAGLTADGLVLQNNNSDDLTISNGATIFNFSTPIAASNDYSVTVKTHPTGLICRVTNGVGTNIQGNVSTVKIECRGCETVGGKKVSGTSACWVNSVISDPTKTLRCSDVCSGVGLALLDPGPEINETLAGKVCTVYGYTDAPVKVSPGTATILGQANFLSSTSCIWNDLTSTNWNNPNNIDYSPTTGNYICPCI